MDEGAKIAAGWSYWKTRDYRMNFTHPPLVKLIATLPYIALDPKETPTTRAATVVFNVAAYGINSPGTVYRMDDVPIPLRPAFESPNPNDHEVLHNIETRVRVWKGIKA